MRNIIATPLVLGFLWAPLAKARIEGKDPDALQESITTEVKARLTPLIEKYCPSNCEIINVDSLLEESVPASEELGFESITKAKSEETQFAVKSFNTDIQIDKSVTEAAKNKLHSIFSNNLKTLKTDFLINWIMVDNPGIGGLDAEDNLRNELKLKIETVVQKAISDFCPETCILSYIDVTGRLMQNDENRALSQKNIFDSKDKTRSYLVRDISIHLTLDSKINPMDRDKFLNLIKAATNFITPINLSTDVIEFPESFLKQQERQALESKDPYGLEKLRQMLIIFKELAGTKEIITSTETKSEKKESTENSSNTSTNSSNSSSNSFVTGEWFSKYGVAALIGLLAILFMISRMFSSNRDAKIMIDTMHRQEPSIEKKQSNQNEKQDPEIKDPKFSAHYDDRNRLEKLRSEVSELMVKSPEASKETFTRMIQEDGIESTAKYLHIFGKIIVFELLSDHTLNRGLLELSEYYQKSSFRFSAKEEYDLLLALRTKLLGNEIKVLTQKTVDAFEFLNKLDPSHIYTLIIEEKPQVQGIVLTQLASKVRHVVFSMISGDHRVSLMNELCKADAIPKEYLINVAQALKRKVSGRPEFDTQNLRSSDVLLEFMEKSSLTEQRQIMKNLMDTNPDAARAIKLKLVTMEMLPFLKDGRLLDLILGLEREDLLVFLSGAEDKIKELFLSRAPFELRESWMEDLESRNQVDEGRYGLVQMVILGKIRQMAATGQLNIVDINDRIFDFTSESKQSNEKRLKLASHHVIA